MTFSLDSTIFAWATPTGPAARAILRVSGPDTFKILSEVFVTDEPYEIRRGVTAGFLRTESETAVRGQVWSFIAPASFTGQDLAEIHVVGNPPLRRMIDQEMLKRGLTPAQAGEFSARAFLLGKMDLTQAQAIRELIEARNDAQINAAMNMLHGRLHRWLTDIYGGLCDLAVKLEVNLDFSEEDIQEISLDEVETRLASLEEAVTQILRQAIDARAISNLPRVFLVGPANAGKSTLLNRLTGLDRAICSPLPGTTRDILSAPWVYSDREVMLCDSPGLVESPHDPITRLAIERAVKTLPLADLTLLVLDAAAPLEPQMQLIGRLGVDYGKTIVTLNKSDRLDTRIRGKQLTQMQRFTKIPSNAVFVISGLTGENTAELATHVFRRLGDLAVTTGQQQVVLDLRGREILEATLTCLRQARQDVLNLQQNESILGPETVVVAVQEALHTVGRILGKDVTEDVLAAVFSRFCIGK